MNVINKYIKIITLLVIILLVFSTCLIRIIKIHNSEEQATWTIDITDFYNNKAIEGAEVAISELNKIYFITEKSNMIKLPCRPLKSSSKTGLYPYGYTIITYAKGYLPRIDHNLPAGAGQYTIYIKLEKSQPFKNNSYTEFFNKSSTGLVSDFTHYYFGNRPEE